MPTPRRRSTTACATPSPCTSAPCRRSSSRRMGALLLADVSRRACGRAAAGGRPDRWPLCVRLTRLAASDRKIAFIGAHSGRVLSKCEGHLQGVTDVAWSCDGGLLASGSDDATVRLWDVAAVRGGGGAWWLPLCPRAPPRLIVSRMRPCALVTAAAAAPAVQGGVRAAAWACLVCLLRGCVAARHARRVGLLRRERAAVGRPVGCVA